jgi:CRP/FNR family transcriptional regulator, cyclic AMP receptor protein
MTFASRQGAKARTLAVTAPGWYGGIRDSGLSATPTGSELSRPVSVHHERTSQSSDAGNAASNKTIVSYKRGKEIFGPRQGVGLVYIVHSGCVRHYKTLPDGRSINFGLLGPNTIFTQEIDSDGLSSGTAAEALVDSTLSIVEAENLADLIRRAPELATSVVLGMSRRLSELQTLTEHLLARDTSVRLATTLLTLARGFGRPMADGLTAITLPMTHQNLANMIGSNRVTVTRKLVELQERGAVRALGRNAIAVDPDMLLSHARAAASA